MMPRAHGYQVSLVVDLATTGTSFDVVQLQLEYVIPPLLPTVCVATDIAGDFVEADFLWLNGDAAAIAT